MFGLIHRSKKEYTTIFDSCLTDMVNGKHGLTLYDCQPVAYVFLIETKESENMQIPLNGTGRKISNASQECLLLL